MSSRHNLNSHLFLVVIAALELIPHPKSTSQSEACCRSKNILDIIIKDVLTFQHQVLDCSEKICSRKPNTSPSWCTDFQLTSIHRSLLLRLIGEFWVTSLGLLDFLLLLQGENTSIHTGTLPRRAGLTCCWTSSHPLCPGWPNRLLAWHHLVCQCWSTPIPLSSPCPLPDGELKLISFLLASNCLILQTGHFSS